MAFSAFLVTRFVFSENGEPKAFNENNSNNEVASPIATKGFFKLFLGRKNGPGFLFIRLGC
jgi:hypothetical protein